MDAALYKLKIIEPLSVFCMQIYPNLFNDL